MTECDTASHVHCPSKDSQMFNFWGYLSHKLTQAKSSLLNIYERQRFSCSPSLYKQRLTNGHLLREHIDVQYFFVMWVVKYRFHLVGQLTTQLVSFTPCPAGCPWAARVSSVPKLRARPRVVRRGHEFWGWRAYGGKVGKKSTTYSFSQPTLSLNSHPSNKVYKWYKET